MSIKNIFLLSFFIIMSCDKTTKQVKTQSSQSTHENFIKKQDSSGKSQVKDRKGLYKQLNQRQPKVQFSSDDLSPEGFNYIHYDFARFISKTVYAHNMDDVIRQKSATTKKPLLEKYIKSLQVIKIKSFDNWKEIHRKSFLINAYHAFMAKKMIDNDFNNLTIKTMDEANLIELFGKKYSFNQFIEKQLLKHYKDRNLILSLHCFSDECPEFRNTIYNYKNIEEQLKVSATRYLRHPDKLVFDTKKYSMKLTNFLKKYREYFPKTNSQWQSFLKPFYNKDSSEWAMINSAKFKVIP